MSDVKPEICFVRRNRTPFGGAEKYLERLSNQLSELGYTHRIINSRLPRFIPSFLRVLFFNVSVCSSKGNKFYFSLERISCPDIYRAGDGVHRQFLLTRKKSFNLLNPVYLYLERRCFNNAHRIIANSLMVRNEIIKHYSIDSRKISVIYSGVELDIDNSLAGSVRQELSIDPSTRIILFVGSGFARKGVSEMLRLMAKLERNFFVIIVGKDKHISHYIALSEQLGLADKVKFTGPVRDVDRYYVDSDILMLPARYEPFSNVALEAMRGGNAVITTRQNGAAEILQDEFVMKESADENILPVLQRLLDEADYLAKTKQQNLDTVREFSIENNARKTLALIEATMKDLS
ncbi:MAG: glycosyltransferase family 4 protein [Gammaproteobacteria bacterium]|nr:glycosyltransferase family 4 protein [Gammaproteobacteria bacterium]